mgnify:CR=1 FL=1
MPAFLALMYHALDEAASDYALPWATWQAHLERLAGEGWVVEGFAGLEWRLSAGPWPERYLVMTFDDGHRSFLRAAEELNRRGMQASFFLTRQACEARPDFLKTPDIRALADLAEIGAHGLSHQPLTWLDREAAQRELSESRRWLEDLIGRPVRHMTAPGGYWNRRCQHLAREVGYTLVGTSVQWWNLPAGVAASRQVRRVALRRSFSPQVFARVLRRDPLFFVGRRLRAGLLTLPNALRGWWEVRRGGLRQGR